MKPNETYSLNSITGEINSSFRNVATCWDFDEDTGYYWIYIKRNLAVGAYPTPEEALACLNTLNIVLHLCKFHTAEEIKEFTIEYNGAEVPKCNGSGPQRKECWTPLKWDAPLKWGTSLKWDKGKEEK